MSGNLKSKRKLSYEIIQVKILKNEKMQVSYTLIENLKQNRSILIRIRIKYTREHN